MAQLVERSTEKPGAVLTQVRVPGAGSFFLFVFIPESISSADSLTVSIKPPVQSHALASVCMIKIPNSGSYTVVWTPTLLHTLVGMGSAALAPTVPYPDTATRICSKGQRSTLKIKKKPPCAIACINIRAHVKSPKHWQPCRCLDKQKDFTLR